MPRAYSQLDLAERRTIFRLLNAKTPVAAIAQEVGRRRSTIQREIHHNRKRSAVTLDRVLDTHGGRWRHSTPMA